LRYFVELMEELLVQWLLLDQSQEFMTVQKVLWELQSVPPLELLLLVLGYSYVEYQCPSFFP
jgi:vancomycin permeability regulator SanA